MLTYSYENIMDYLDFAKGCFPIYSFYSEEDEVADTIATQIFGDDYACKVAAGASKFVIMPEDREDIVIKLPFEGEEEEPFYCAGNSVNDWDYCLTELEVYQKAVAAGLEQYFCKIEIVKVIHTYASEDVPVYVQQKAKVLSDISHPVMDSEERREFMKEVFERVHNVLSATAEWIKDFIKEYGYEELQRLSNFIEENHIGDLHSGNVGYLNGKPVLVDYSDFSC